MKGTTIHLIMCDGDIVYATKDRSIAIDYVTKHNDIARQIRLKDLDKYDDREDEKDADIINAYESGYYKRTSVEIPTNAENEDIIELSNGEEISVSEIIEKLQ